MIKKILPPIQSGLFALKYLKNKRILLVIRRIIYIFAAGNIILSQNNLQQE